MFFCSPRKLRKIPKLTNIFQLGWFNHQRVALWVFATFGLVLLWRSFWSCESHKYLRMYHWGKTPRIFSKAPNYLRYTTTTGSHKVVVYPWSRVHRFFPKQFTVQAGVSLGQASVLAAHDRCQMEYKQFTVGVLNATLDLAALVLVGVVGFLGSEVVLSPVVSHCLPLSPIVSGCLPLCGGWVLVGVAAFLGSEVVLSPVVSGCLPSCGGWVLVGVAASRTKIFRNQNHWFQSKFAYCKLFGVYAGVIVSCDSVS